MLDDDGCLLCGKPVASNSAYCSPECSAADDDLSTSFSAPSSVHHSPLLIPQDYPHHSSDLPSLVYPHARTSRGLSSSSTIDTDDSLYPPDLRSPFNFNRRPSATNHRATIPTLHKRTSSNTSVISSYSGDPSFTLIGKGWNDISMFGTTIGSSPSSSSSSSSPLSSDVEEEEPQHPISASFKKHHYRASLPAYFSRLSIDPSSSSALAVLTHPDSMSDHDTPVQLTARSHPFRPHVPSPSPAISSSASPGQGKSSSSLSTSGDTTVATNATPRGRGRERRKHAHVRQGASRSRSPSRSSPPPLPPHRAALALSISPILPPHVEEQLRTSLSRVAHTPPIPTQKPAALQITHTPPVVGGLGYARSLGERAIRTPADVQRELQAREEERVREEEEVVERGRKMNPVHVNGGGGEERERGRSRVVVKRRGSGSPHHDHNPQ